MSNPYKEILSNLLIELGFAIFDRKICIFCDTVNTELIPINHEQWCPFLQAKTLLDQNPDREEDNPWILCSERLPEEDGEYEITLKTLADFSRGEFDWSEYNSCGNSDVVNWRRKLKPYQPPAQKPETPVAEPEKTPEPTPDPLMGWTPVWKEKPNDQRDVKIILKIPDEIIREYRAWIDSRGNWYIFYKIDPREYEKVDPNHQVLAWKNTDRLPDPTFAKPATVK
jgi:hypothetical protein